MRRLKDRRRAQAGTTLVELLVSLTIASMALALIVGALSTGLLNASIAKRNTAAQAAMQYEMETIGASAFSSSSAPYSDCFATESQTSPAAASKVLALIASISYCRTAWAAVFRLAIVESSRPVLSVPTTSASARLAITRLTSSSTRVAPDCARRRSFTRGISELL